ncbi:CHASE4 domain-containing protein [Chloroflexota bacterium]
MPKDERMNLRTKTLLIIGLSFICLAGIIYAISQFVLLEGLTTIEEHDTRQNVERALGTLSYLVSDLEAKTVHQAAWDDTYTFIEDTNNEYIRSNLTYEAFINLRLNLMLFFDSSGQLVFGKAFDLDNEEEIPISQSLLGHISDNPFLTDDLNPESNASGIILLGEDPMLIASQPILTSEYTGPTRGTLILGRYLDSTTINYLAQVTLFPITVHRIDDVMVPDFQKALLSLLLQEVPIYVQPLDAHHIGGYTLIEDIYEEPFLVLRVDIPRNTYQLGQVSIIYHLLSIFGIGMLMTTVVILGIEKQVLSRFTTLVRGINRIATSGDVSARISMKGKDELALVANTINGMLGALQESETELKELYQNEKGLRRGLEKEIQKRLDYTRALVHELKTPITPVLAATELLIEEIKEEHLAKLVQSIDRGASNLNRRIDELLDLARGELDMLELNLEPIDPMSLLQEIGDEMVPIALDKKQSLTFELPSSIPAIPADRERLRQIIQNLLNNALKFTPVGGKIILRAKEDDANLVVEIQDTGPGISKENLKRLFDPYQQIGSDKERLSGLGLGLTLSKNLVELHGGQIWVKSQKGKGSTFGFSVPFEAASRKEQSVELGGKS